MKSEDAEEYTQSLGQIVAGSWRQIALAKRLGIPKALGVSTEDWVTQRLGGYIRMSVEERREAVATLAADGHSNRAIGEVLGVGKDTVARDLGANAPPEQPESKDTGVPENGGGANAPLDAVAALAASDEVRRTAKKTARRRENEQRRNEQLARPPSAVERLERLPERHFGVIYSDPPWTFEVYSGKGKDRSAERHYDTMTVEDIMGLSVERLAADDCALFLWCVMPELPGALRVIKAWGFEYKTCAFVWMKQNRGGEGIFTGMGYWTRANAEMCLLATRGAPERIAMDVHQIVMAPVAKHSKKPSEVRARIERLLQGPYLELFGRELVKGWTVWGNDPAILGGTNQAG